MQYFKEFLISLSLLILVPVSVSAATDYGEIQLLIKQQKFDQALTLTNGLLAKDAGDIKLQFMKGLILTRLERLGEAEQVFQQITSDNPQLPEPYNNLAVVYAAQGKYDQAEQALKDAINTHPSYATAHENLGDIYAKMASQAYNQALELDTTNVTARAKLSLVNELISDPDVSQPATPTKVAAAKPTPEPKPDPAPAPEKKSVPTEPEIITIPAKKPEPEKTETKVAAMPPQKTVAEPTADPAEELSRNRDQVSNALNNWADAWSAQDVAAYLASYSDQFVPAKNQSFGSWKKERSVRLKRPGYIKITLSDVKINIHGKDYAEVRFKQRYKSDTYGDIVKKELLMRKVDDKWLITQERTR